MVPDAFDKATSPTRIGAVLDAIQNGRWRSAVEVVRQKLLEGGKEAAKPYKETLPAPLFSGVFSRAEDEGLVSYNQIMVVDIDDRTIEEIVRLREMIQRDPHVLAVFLSPSGTGLKVLVIVGCDGARHRAAYLVVEERFKKLYKIDIDEKCKNPSRLCFVSYDPDLYINESVVPLEIPEQVETTSTPLVDVDNVLVLPGNGVSITGSAEKIFRRIAPTRTMFWRGGSPHELERELDGSMRLAPLSPSSFRSRVERYGITMAYRADNQGRMALRQVPMPEETAKAMLASLPARDELPPIASILACPIIAMVGTELQVLGRGYHAVNGGVFITGGENPPEVPLAEAVPALLSLIADYDFLTPGDHARAIAETLTPALRFGGIHTGHIPVQVGEADASQAGKGFRQNLNPVIYRERPQVITQRTGGVGSTDESISQNLISGRPFIQLDNYRGKLDSTLLEAITTPYGDFAARVPHKGEVRVDPRRFVFMLTSNGVETTRDLANRSSIVRIRKRPAGFQWRTWPDGRVDQHIRVHQAYYLGCVFAVIIAWAKAGRPTTAESRHDFREWSQSLDWIGQHLLGTAPLMDGHDEARERVSNPALTWLRRVALALSEDGRLVTPRSASALMSSAGSARSRSLACAPTPTTKRLGRSWAPSWRACSRTPTASPSMDSPSSGSSNRGDRAMCMEVPSPSRLTFSLRRP